MANTRNQYGHVPKILHITNGDHTARLVRQACDIATEVLPWRDILYEGPVPAHESLEELSDVRASYLANAGHGEEDALAAWFNRRNTTLADCNEFDEVVLWFEHDLYDQLQMIQVLDYFSALKNRPAVSLICIGQHTVMEEFYGLTQLSAAQLRILYTARVPLHEKELSLAQAAWRAFTAPSPISLEAFCGGDLESLPFLRNALMRHLEEYPDYYNGLTRSESYVLQAITKGETCAGEIFQSLAQNEGERYMGIGDISFWKVVQSLSDGEEPLLHYTEELIDDLEDVNVSTLSECYLSITDVGRAVLQKELDWPDINGIDTWRGGVHLTKHNLWRWDSEQERLIQGSLPQQ